MDEACNFRGAQYEPNIALKEISTPAFREPQQENDYVYQHFGIIYIKINAQCNSLQFHVSS